MVGASEPWKARTVGCEVGTRPSRFQQILRLGSFVGVSPVAQETFVIDGVHADVVAVELLILGGLIDEIGDGRLLRVTLLVDAGLSEVRLHVVQFAEVAAAVAGLADTEIGVMVIEVAAEQFAGGQVQVLLVRGLVVKLLGGLGQQRLRSS